MRQPILVIAAHPDDEVLGCGGTIARSTLEGRPVHIAILGEGLTSRQPNREETDSKGVDALAQHATDVGAFLGAAAVHQFRYPDNRFDEVPLLDVVKTIEALIDEIRPSEVFTQHGGDLNIDHVVTFRATMTATRPVAGFPVGALYAYEVPSSSEWAFAKFEPRFEPNYFVDITSTLDRKVQAMAMYATESRVFPHPRSPEDLGGDRPKVGQYCRRRRRRGLSTDMETGMSTVGMTIAGHRIGPDHPVYVVAELSANHSQDYGRAEELVHAAAEAGADAVKLQTYTPDTMTIDCDAEEFRIRGTIWEGRTLYDLYQEAYTPWEWQPKLMDLAASLGISMFSTPFDATAVDFLEEMGVPAYKVASFEIVDLPLIEKMAACGKPIIMSIGMANREEVRRAVTTARDAGANEIALLRCTSAYPASPEEADLRTIPDLAESFSAVPGLSDHTLDIVVPITAVALGARIVEKHLTLSRNDPGPDSSFSLEPAEFKDMVEAIRTTEKALGMVRYGPREGELPSQVFRRSLFVVADIKRGEPFTLENVRSIRPGHGLPPALFDQVIGKPAARDLARGTPLRQEDIDQG